MVTFRNNRRNRFRSQDRNFRRNNDNSRIKFRNDLTNTGFQKNIGNRNNHNAAKLAEKYNNLAREALVNEDKISSENYYQHAEHFIRILEEQKSKSTNSISESNNKNLSNKEENKDTNIEENPKNLDKKIVSV